MVTELRLQAARCICPITLPPAVPIPVPDHVRCPSKPLAQRINETQRSAVSHPRDIAVGPDQDGSGGRHRPDCRKLPCAGIVGIDETDPICPRCDIDASRCTEVEQYRSGMV